MNIQIIIRGIFIFGCVVMGALWSVYIMPLPEDPGVFHIIKWVFPGMIVGGALGALVVYGLQFVTQELFERLMPAFVATTLGMIVGFGISSYLLIWVPNPEPNFQIYLTTTFVLIFGFMGVFLGITRASNWDALIEAMRRDKTAEMPNPKIIDTSVLIDGRLADICQTGFIEGTLIIPRFVLKELQNIADSPDVLRRARGRRGLDIVKAVQDADTKANVVVIEDDPEEVREVDSKLVRVARQYNAKIITNDLNLNKVAQIDGVEVLNVNDLANALKPALLPDEHIEVKIVKEGKEAQQGVGYLDDGTMIVVDGGRDYIGKNVAVIVTSVLQTTAGRMIFTRLQNVLP